MFQPALASSTDALRSPYAQPVVGCVRCAQKCASQALAAVFTGWTRLLGLVTRLLFVGVGVCFWLVFDRQKVLVLPGDACLHLIGQCDDSVQVVAASLLPVVGHSRLDAFGEPGCSGGPFVHISTSL